MLHYVQDKACQSEVLVEGKLSRKVKAHDKNLMLVEVHFENGAVGDIHTHPHEQLAYCAGGVFEFYIEDKVYPIEKGDTIYVPPHLAHGCKLISAEGTLLDIFTPYRADFVNAETN